MLESLNQFTKFLFILILVARISVSQPKESRNAANRSKVSTTNSSTTTNATTQATNRSKNQCISNTPTSIPTNFFDDWAHGLLVAAGALIVLLVSIFTAKTFKYRKRRTSGRNVSCALELRPVSPTPKLGQNEVQNSLYEADTFQSPSRDCESETSEIVETEVDRSTADVECNSDDEYCYPDSIEVKYENMIPVDPLEASGEYARAYDHTNINTGYMNEDGYEVPRDYDYPQNTRDCQDSGFKEATLSSSEPVSPLNKDKVDDTGYMNEDDYEVPHDHEYPQNTQDWRDSGFKEATLSSSEPVTPLNKDNVDDNFYENNQILLRESLENENETDI